MYKTSKYLDQSSSNKISKHYSNPKKPMKIKTLKSMYLRENKIRQMQHSTPLFEYLE